ncbi:hypothetical protein G7K_5649-t1 [Saitoella complicata NRRL Y-17804]|uniref:Uncharacterized protein n=1 Tax=Saitoella complicata (strain BCRC 22490 / CBS 7301 / JCM 7358 / NBRC 10748 / NRRL Y-17804) TaxID=698492 RepID=A0A0E9NQ48_SAICN|nr:hypothetical protein G7K_5649-t1 [Saitoella complicata NRRL Y-17804]
MTAHCNDVTFIGPIYSSSSSSSTSNSGSSWNLRLDVYRFDAPEVRKVFFPGCFLPRTFIAIGSERVTRVSRLNNHHVNLSATAIMCPVWVGMIQATASGEQMGEDRGGVEVGDLHGREPGTCISMGEDQGGVGIDALVSQSASAVLTCHSREAQAEEPPPKTIDPRRSIKDPRPLILEDPPPSKNLEDP